MKEEKIVVSHLRDQPWNENKDQGKFRWKYMADSTQIQSHGLSCGVLVLPPGESLPLHYHSPQEIYIIRRGEDLLLSYFHTRRFVKIVLSIPLKIMTTTKQSWERGYRNIRILTKCKEKVEYNFKKY